MFGIQAILTRTTVIFTKTELSGKATTFLIEKCALPLFAVDRTSRHPSIWKSVTQALMWRLLKTVTRKATRVRYPPGDWNQINPHEGDERIYFVPMNKYGHWSRERKRSICNDGFQSPSAQSRPFNSGEKTTRLVRYRKNFRRQNPTQHKIASLVCRSHFWRLQTRRLQKSPKKHFCAFFYNTNIIILTECLQFYFYRRFHGKLTKFYCFTCKRRD